MPQMEHHSEHHLEHRNAPDLLDRPVKQVRAAEAWASALGWWARTYPGEPVDMGALVRRSGMRRSTAYDYLREYRALGLIGPDNVPAAPQNAAS